MNDFQRQWQDTREDALRAFTCVGESGWYITARELAEFERALAALWTLRHCAGVASGLDAIEIALKALGCRPGDRVLTTPLSAFATTLAIAKLGAIPVFVDTDAFGLIDLDQCAQLLSRRPEIRFLVPVHLYGNALDLAKLARLKERFELTVVEDCAQSILAGYVGAADKAHGALAAHGALTGTVGQCAATSFYPTKNLGAMGDGGAILTNDAGVDVRIRALRDYGQSARYKHDSVGYNSRLDELQAALLHRAYLGRLAGWTARRREIAARYLGGIANPKIRLIGAPAGSHSCFHLFPVTVEPERKPAFLEHLRQNGIGSGEHYPVAIPDQKAMAQIPHEVADECANARRLAAGEVSLPMHAYMHDDEVARVIAACNEWGA
jgi:dTDP-3-amino-3,4,6-trideoxy-alpha-D-glucose transaminase